MIQTKKMKGMKCMKQNRFYTVEPIWKSVTEEEFEDFVKSYPRKLEERYKMICSPPAISYNDFELANKWPYSVVAKTFLYTDDERDMWYIPEEKRTYIIMENYEKVFESRYLNGSKDSKL